MGADRRDSVPPGFAWNCSVAVWHSRIALHGTIGRVGRMSAISSILTHPGGAHKDDFLACAVLIARYPVAIERREPTEEDLASPATIVVDVGHQYAPEKLNFDHHQFSREAAPSCALSLILRWMDRYEDAKEFCDWLEMTEWLDCRGANGTARQFGFDRNLLNQLLSPIDVSLLRRFARSDKLEPGEILWKVMRWIGSDLLEYIETLHARMEALEAEVQWLVFEVGALPVRIAFLPRQDPLDDDPSMGIDHFISRQQGGAEIIGMITPDRRGSGYGLSRYNDDHRLDFVRIEGEADVHYAHANGFVAKTSATDPERLRVLLQAALVE